MRVFSINPNVYSAANNQCCPSKKKQNPAFGASFNMHDYLIDLRFEMAEKNKKGVKNVVEDTFNIILELYKKEKTKFGKTQLEIFADDELGKKIVQSN